MIFVDTNYFLRYFLKDIDSQYKTAKLLFEKSARGEVEAFTSTIVIFEINWVLSSVYSHDRKQITTTLDELLKNPFVTIEERDILRAALLMFKDKSTLSLEDCYNVAYSKVRDAKQFKTFDKKLAREFAKIG